MIKAMITPVPPDTEEWAGRRKGEEERQRRLWRRSAAVLDNNGGVEKEEKKIWRRSAIGVGGEYDGGDLVDHHPWKHSGEEKIVGESKSRGVREDVVMRRRPAPNRGVTAPGRRGGGLVSYTDFGLIDWPPPPPPPPSHNRPGFLRPRPGLEPQGRLGGRWEESERENGKKNRVGREREPSSGPFLRNERGFSGLQQHR